MPAEFEISIAKPADAAAVDALLAASYPVLMRPGYEPAILAAALPHMTRSSPTLLSSDTYYLARSATGDVVGAGGWTRERPGSGEVVPELGHIRHFATHPDWVGRGVGRQIFGRCAEAARAAGIRRFECSASLNAEGFYAALGFNRLGYIEVQMGPVTTFPGALMMRSL